MQLHPALLRGSGFEFLTQQMFAGLLRGVGIYCYANFAVFPFNPGLESSEQMRRSLCQTHNWPLLILINIFCTPSLFLDPVSVGKSSYRGPLEASKSKGPHASHKPFIRKEHRPISAAWRQLS